jgi:hypothetical protein
MELRLVDIGQQSSPRIIRPVAPRALQSTKINKWFPIIMAA